MANLQERLAQAKAQVASLKEDIKRIKDAKNDVTLREACSTLPGVARPTLRTRRTLKGHLAKIYSLGWAEDNVHLCSVSQDAKLLVWDGLSTNKTQVVPLTNYWMMTCCFSPSGQLVAAGGLDNLCSVYDLQSREQPTKVQLQLTAHTGYISCCRFLDEGRVLTSSGDNTLILWSLATRSRLMEFTDHAGDVMGFALHPDDNNLFVSGACDHTAKLWDVRTSKCAQTFRGHTGDVNAIAFFPNGNAFFTGSDDFSARLWDIRADRQVATYHTEDAPSCVTSVAVSASGRYLFAAYEDQHCLVWDALRVENVGALSGHDGRITCLAVNGDGSALASSSWDKFIRIWA